MRTIWEFPFLSSAIVEIQMPKGAEVMDVEMRASTPCLWAIVDTDHPLETRRFRVYGTGNQLNECVSSHKGSWIATFQDGSSVWHIFESE